MVRKVIELPLVYKSYIWYSPEQKRISAHYHRQIVAALAARDAERAELIMKEHVFEARDLLVAHLREPGGVDRSERDAAAAAQGRRATDGPGRSRASAWSSSACSSPGRSPAGCSATWAPRSSRSSRRASPTRCANGARRATRAARSGGPSSRGTRSAARSTCATERGQELLLELVKHSDVLVENFRPGTLERWNLGPDRLWEANPGLVIARVSGYGQTGPYAPRAGFASVAEAMGGIRYINGFPGEPPPRMHISLGDSLAGMFAAQGILAALYRRDALGGGRGQVVDVSLLEACFALLESTVPEYDRLGIVRGPGGTGLKGVAPSNIFRSRDDKWMVIAANADKVFGRLCAAMGQPELADDPRFATHLARGEHQEELEGIVADWARPARRRRDRPPPQRGRRHLRPDLHDRRHLRGPALPGARDAPQARRPGVRRVRRPGDRPEVLRDARARCAGRRPWEEGSHNRGRLRRAARALRRGARPS